MVAKSQRNVHLWDSVSRQQPRKEVPQRSVKPANVMSSRFDFLPYKNVVVFNHNGLDQIYCNDCCETSDEIESMALSVG